MSTFSALRCGVRVDRSAQTPFLGLRPGATRRRVAGWREDSPLAPPDGASKKKSKRDKRKGAATPRVEGGGKGEVDGAELSTIDLGQGKSAALYVPTNVAEVEGADGGVYRPPKMMPTAMEEFEEGGKSSKQKRAEKEARRRAQRSSLIKVRIVDRLRAVLFRSPARFVSLRSPFASSISVSRGDERRPVARPHGVHKSYQTLGRVPLKCHEWSFPNQGMDIHRRLDTGIEPKHARTFHQPIPRRR